MATTMTRDEFFGWLRQIAQGQYRREIELAEAGHAAAATVTGIWGSFDGHYKHAISQLAARAGMSLSQYSTPEQVEAAIRTFNGSRAPQQTQGSGASGPGLRAVANQQEGALTQLMAEVRDTLVGLREVAAKAQEEEAEEEQHPTRQDLVEALDTVVGAVNEIGEQFDTIGRTLREVRDALSDD